MCNPLRLFHTVRSEKETSGYHSGTTSQSRTAHAGSLINAGSWHVVPTPNLGYPIKVAYIICFVFRGPTQLVGRETGVELPLSTKSPRGDTEGFCSEMNWASFCLIRAVNPLLCPLPCF